MNNDLSMSRALDLMAELQITVFPIFVYDNKEDYNSIYREAPHQVWWCALQTGGGVYLPLEQYSEGQEDAFIRDTETCLHISQLAETLPGAVQLAAAVAAENERKWQEEQDERKRRREASDGDSSR